jgi:hypothetical protein
MQEILAQCFSLYRVNTSTFLVDSRHTAADYRWTAQGSTELAQHSRGSGTGRGGERRFMSCALG